MSTPATPTDPRSTDIDSLKSPSQDLRTTTDSDDASSRSGFTRGNTKSNSNLRNAAANSPTTQQHPPMPALPPQSPISNYSPHEKEIYQEPPKKFLNERYAKCSVKGNFLTLAAQPKNVELGEWLAHQVVEMNRLLTGLIQVIQEVDTNTGLALCNEQSCPTMSAGRLTYTWLENGRPAKIPAPSYIVRVQRWIVGKIHDPNVFPTQPPVTTDIAATAYASGDINDSGSSTPIAAPPTNLNASLAQLSGLKDDWIGRASGFNPNFHNDVKGIIKQMFRCYAHLYHNHWDNPFWHINRHLELNSCFVHFMTVSMYYDLLPRKDMEPLQGLVDIFVQQEVIPKEAVRQHQS